MARSRDELLEHLQEQVDFLVAGMRSYDSGQVHFAKPLSATLRGLLHHGGSSHALLEQLGVRSSMLFPDSGGELVEGQSYRPLSKLAIIKMSDGDVSYAPICEAMGDQPARLPPHNIRAQTRFQLQHHRKISRGGDWWPFATWWDLPVLGGDQDEFYSRHQIVLAVANKEGGTHIDPKLPAWYDRLANSPMHGVAFHDAQGEELIRSPVLPTIRQVAQEVRQALVREFPDLRTE